MGHRIRYWCGGTLLIWSIVVVSTLSSVNGFPLATNGSLSATVESDLALSSEEQEDEDALADYPINKSPPFGKTSPSHISIYPQQETVGFPDLSFNETKRAEDKSHNKTSAASELVDDPAESSHIVPATLVRSTVSKLTASEKNTEPYSSSGVGGGKYPPRSGRLVKDDEEVKIIGLSIDYDSDKRRVEYDIRGSPVILEGLEVRLTLYGRFTNDTYFRFSKFNRCDDPKNTEKEHKVDIIEPDFMSVGIVDVKLPEAGELNEVYLCLRGGDSLISKRQGESSKNEFGLPLKPWLLIKLYKSMFPFYLHVLFIVVLLMLSGLFSGLNLGLMSLDKTDLKIIMNTGSKSEKNYAQSIAPVRNHGNFLLCCLLFSNVLVNATLTILVDDLTTGLIAICGSTLAIVIFGEIIPQAICSRYGLAVGARTIYITKFFMIVTSPLAYPLSILLDKVLGEEIGNIYTRERLKELLKVTKDHHGLDFEEVGIISGALDLKEKSVKDVMITVEHIFMLPADTALDYDTMSEIEYQGYSRIPVYDGDRSNVVALINVRQLTLLDASDNIPLRTLMDYYKTTLFFVFENTRLDYMFKAFREGSRGHMAFVQRVNDDGPGDPYYETVGMLTMEDVLEEILQADIRDENDVDKLNARSGNTKRPALQLANRKTKRAVDIPAPLALAATQFLITSVAPFKDGKISITIIQRLLKTNVRFLKAPKKKARQQCIDVFLYENGKPADCFTMILEGRVQVKVGKERLTYEAGSFTTFGNDFLMYPQSGATSRNTNLGESALNSPTDVDTSERPSITSDITDLKRRPTFVPDYTVKLLTDVYFFHMKYDNYRHAIAATELEKAYSNDPEKAIGNSEWQYEIEKVLDTGEDEDDGKTDDPNAGGDREGIIIPIHNNIAPSDKDTSTTESDESDNKDNEHDDNHPTEVTKLLHNDTAYS